jgi:hypothetical protein
MGELLRELAPQVLGTLVRRYGRFGAADAVISRYAPQVAGLVLGT